MKKLILFIITLTLFLSIIPVNADDNKVVYLTFDDGPNHIGTNKILDVLDKYNIKATFFIIGEFASYYPERVQAVYKSGHLIGCHTYSHRYNNIYSSKEDLMNEVYEWEELIYKIIGTELQTKLFRFPGGSTNNFLRKERKLEMIDSLHDEGYRIFDWNVSNNDAHVLKSMNSKTREEYVKQAFIQSLDMIENIPNVPKIILMHDVKKHTADTLEWIIEYLIDCGYTFETLDKLNHTCLFETIYPN